MFTHIEVDNAVILARIGIGTANQVSDLLVNNIFETSCGGMSVTRNFLQKNWSIWFENTRFQFNV